MDFIVTMKIYNEVELRDPTVVLKIFNGDYGYHLLSREVMSWKVPLQEKNSALFFYLGN